MKSILSFFISVMCIASIANTKNKTTQNDVQHDKQSLDKKNDRIAQMQITPYLTQDDIRMD